MSGLNLLFAKLGDVGSPVDFSPNWPDLTTLVLLTSIQWEGSLKKLSQGDSFGGDKANFTFCWLWNEFVMLYLIMIENSTSVDLSTRVTSFTSFAEIAPSSR